ncbi:MAG: site-specific integrase [Candidatus Thermoplasmatota archaeon]|nr:site-specific integrase [Candidatus Thermoplasmatota archaeon]
MASIHRNHHGIYILDATVRGRRARRSVGRDRREAERICAETNRQIARDALGLPTTDAPARQSLEDFLRDRKGRNGAKWVSYQRQILEDFLAFSRVSRLGQIAPITISRWQTARLERISLKAGLRGLKILRTWMRWCKRFGLVSEDPTDRVERLPKPPKSDITYLTHEEAGKLLGQCMAPIPFHGPGRKGSRSHPRKTPLYQMASVGIYAGLRASEIMQLRWRDVDLGTNGKGTVNVRVSEHFVPKDREGRQVPLHPALREVLKRYRNGAKPEDLLFQTSTGKAFHRRFAVRQLQGAAARANIDGGCNFNRLRHTFATWMVQANVSIFDVSKLLGHSSVVLTQRYYAAFVPGRLHAQIERLPTIRPDPS